MTAPETPSQYKALLEKLADLEHQQWMEWANNLMERESNLSLGRTKRWQALMVPYSQLPEINKEQDRKWARKIIKEVFYPEMSDFTTKMMQGLAEIIREA